MLPLRETLLVEVNYPVKPRKLLQLSGAGQKVEYSVRQAREESVTITRCVNLFKVVTAMRTHSI